ncbi:MAG: transcription termination factor NusA [Candidatus Moraniibacteriota bacterium]
MPEDSQFYSESQTGHLSEWGAAIAQICEEKGISRDAMIGVIASSLSAAYKKETGRKGHIVRAEFDEKTGGARFFEIYRTIEKAERDWSKELPVWEFDGSSLDKSRKPKIWEEEKFEDREQKEDKLPYFRPEREMLLPDARKFLPKIKVSEYLALPVKAPKDFGRIAAQTAKQVVLQKIKEIEKEIIYDEYYKKIGEVLPGTVQRIEGVQVHVDLGKTIALLPRKEQVIGERYDQGQRLKVYVLRVDFESRSSMVIVSRSHPGLVEGLFRLEVPEIFAGTVDVVKVVREPGQRAKVAVMSKDEGVDPVGSCIGQRGTRVQAVTDELRGERIDIVEYSEDPIVFLERAISPAKVKKIEIVDGVNKRVKVFVDKDQQSIAIGRSGQNVRLASRLAGWEIDIELWEGMEEAKETEKAEMKKVEVKAEKTTGEKKEKKPAKKAKTAKKAKAVSKFKPAAKKLAKKSAKKEKK